ncbi:MAG: 50S ribosomal protein L3 [bacterium]|nr:50S ribosomal protein L3 [bacterium]MDZ4284799.1 50S ribosomal protein L3 [Patescibacteria group bacterium]
MKFILATKQHMTQLFDEDGRAYPATLLTAGPVTVTQTKSKERDGYRAVQVGFGAQKAQRLSAQQRGHLKGLGAFRTLREFRLAESEAALERGAMLDVSQFAPGERVRVSATSKGKGFQGVVKRHGFKGGPRSHGQKHSEREPGSIGGGGRAGGRVVKGMRMAGRMGGDRVTVRGLRVLAVDPEAHELLLRGAVPGRRGTLVEVRG